MKITTISILEKVRAPSRIKFRKGLGCCDSYARRGTLVAPEFQSLVVDDPAHHPAERAERPDGRQHPLVLKRVQNGCGGEQNEAERVRRDQELHGFSLLQGTVLGGTLPQRSAVFSRNSDDTTNIAYIRLEIKYNRKSPYFWAFSRISYWIKKFSSPKFKIWFPPSSFDYAQDYGRASEPTRLPVAIAPGDCGQVFFSGFFCGFH